jgi:hypothetical protein
MNPEGPASENKPTEVPGEPIEDEITAAINRVCDEVGDTSDPFVTEAARRTLMRVKW